MHDDILKLALDLSRTTGEKIGSIDKIMVKTQILSMNARLEAARAGTAGKSFAIVAQEMGNVTDEVSALSADLHAAISDNATRIEAAGRQMMLDFRGKRFADMSRNAVEIIDRNLYERSCDVRWWATDSAVVNAVQTPSPDALEHASGRLGTILRSYTVYLDLWIADRRGVVVANGRPDRYRGVVGQNVSNTEWFRKGMATVSGDDFIVCDIDRSNALGGAQVATYATAIRADGQERGAPLGVLGIFFDWEPQATDIVRGVSLSEAEARNTRVMLLNANHRVIASSTAFSEGEIYPLMPTEPCGYYQRGKKLVSYALTPGYETYKGLGWYGCIESKLSD
ncbi:methyl-accepting chemotaxis protein [Sphingobium sufflavum]|uniref:cache domain-containing protein n=1 Tax=Sphingobium sufflavum TaxID=1129547 RepID=UPI001F464531|nr:cache domain-containing protein [Sphingobium sufflavum]MCE7795036.1 methyl-accepting chemotaxis protein [Sphingobium sufflavum]